MSTTTTTTIKTATKVKNPIYQGKKRGLPSLNRVLFKVAVLAGIVLIALLFYAFLLIWQLSDFHMTVTATLVLHTIIYWFVGGLCVYLDEKRLLAAFKIQPGAFTPLATQLHCAEWAVINQVFVLWPTIYFLWPAFQARGVLPLADLPTIPQFLVQFVVCLATEEIGFYYGHRFLHIPFFYRHVHQMHHEFTAPIAMSCEYAHPIEMLFVNVLPLVLGPIIGGAHLVTMWVWLATALLSTLYSHSGYHSSYSPFGESTSHDFHHSARRDNYGSLGILDWFHGTSVYYQAWLAKQQPM